MKLYLLIVLLFFAPVATYTQGVEASRLRKTVFANLGTPSGSNIRDCTDCGIAANGTCASGGTGATATRRNGAWYCSTGGTAGAAGTVTTTGSPSSGNMTKFSGATSITNATPGTDYVAPGAVPISAPLFCSDAGSTDAYACSLSPTPTLVTGTHYRFKANTANVGAATINFNSLGAVTIKKVAGGVTTDLADNDIRVGQWVDVVYDGTNMQMQSTLGNAAGGGTTINPTNSVLPQRSDASTFIDSPITGSVPGSMVNGITVTGGASGNSPNIAATGSGTNLDINLTPKGTGSSGGKVIVSTEVVASTGDTSFPSYSYAGHLQSGTSYFSGIITNIDNAAILQTTGASQLLGSGITLGFANTTNPAAGAADTAYSRCSANLHCFGSGAAGDFSGTIKAATANATTNYQINGVTIYSGGTPSIAGNATLNTGSKDSAGKVTATGTGASTIVLTFSITFTRAPACFVTNETTSNLVRPLSTTTTLTFNATIVTGDSLSYQCSGY